MSSPEATLIGVLADTTGPRQTRTAFAGQEGLEPPTTGFGDRDSGQLSYCPTASRTPPRTVAGAQPSPGGPPPVDEVYVARGPSSTWTPRPRRSRRPDGRSSGSGRANPTSPPPATSSRRPSGPAPSRGSR